MPGIVESVCMSVGRKGTAFLPTHEKSDKFVWTPQADEAFTHLKKMLATAPVLASPLSKEPMLLYIAATNRVVSEVIVVERNEKGKSV